MLKPLAGLLAATAVFAAPSPTPRIPPDWQQRIIRLENLQEALTEKLLVTLSIVETQQQELAMLRDCLPECFPPEKWEGGLLPIPPD